MMLEMETIEPGEIVIARKWSVLEWEMYHKKISREEFVRLCNKAGVDTKAILESHEAQISSLEKVLGFFDTPPKVVIGETLTRKALKGARAVLSLGGDDHNKYVSHFLDKQLFMGVNSDRDKSEGATLYFLPDDLKDFLPRLYGGNYNVEEWPRLKATIQKNGHPPFEIRQYAMSEIYAGTWARISMTKYNFEVDGERHKDSGALFALPAGTGTSSWFDSAGGNSIEDHKSIPRTTKVAWYLPTEVWHGRTLPEMYGVRQFLPGEKIELKYTSYYDGVVSIDPKEKSGRNYRLDRGNQLVIEFSDKPLRVISPHNNGSHKV